MTDNTPNLHLDLIPANTKIWAERDNNNLKILDAVFGAYFVVQNLQGIWANATNYTVGQCVIDSTSSVVYQCQIANTSSLLPTTFAEERALYPTYWTVFSSPARARGVWMPLTSYALNDFVVSGSQYAVCIQTHISGADFAVDVIAGKWSILVDLSQAGSQVLPVPGGAGDANKTVTTTAGGTGYTIRSVADMLTMFGATATGLALFTAASQADARNAIDAQVVGSYQPLDADLTAIAALSTTSFGRSLLTLANAAALRTSGLIANASIAGSGLGVINRANGISAVTRLGVGQFEITMSVAAADVLYTIVATTMADNTFTGFLATEDPRIGARTTSKFYIATTDGVTYRDPASLNIMVIK